MSNVQLNLFGADERPGIRLEQMSSSAPEGPNYRRIAVFHGSTPLIEISDRDPDSFVFENMNLPENPRIVVRGIDGKVVFDSDASKSK